MDYVEPPIYYSQTVGGQCHFLFEVNDHEEVDLKDKYILGLPLLKAFIVVQGGLGMGQALHMQGIRGAGDSQGHLRRRRRSAGRGCGGTFPSANRADDTARISRSRSGLFSKRFGRLPFRGAVERQAAAAHGVLAAVGTSRESLCR